MSGDDVIHIKSLNTIPTMYDSRGNNLGAVQASSSFPAIGGTFTGTVSSTFVPTVDGGTGDETGAINLGELNDGSQGNGLPTYLTIGMKASIFAAGGQFFEFQVDDGGLYTVAWMDKTGKLKLDGGLQVGGGSVSLTGIVPLILGSGDLTMVGGFIHLAERADPVGAINAARIYSKDNGAGKTQLMVQFPTGTPIQLAIEA